VRAMHTLRRRPALAATTTLESPKRGGGHAWGWVGTGMGGMGVHMPLGQDSDCDDQDTFAFC
jgi:hypothetical protein